MNELKKYYETEFGGYTFEGMSIPKTIGNRHYRRMIRECGMTVEEDDTGKYVFSVDLETTISAEIIPFDHAAKGKIDAVSAERQWRDSELSRADIELNKVQDGASGTVAEWRDYRNDLRSWPEHLNFPSSTYRPKAPDA